MKTLFLIFSLSLFIGLPLIWVALKFGYFNLLSTLCVFFVTSKRDAVCWYSSLYSRLLLHNPFCQFYDQIHALRDLPPLH